VHLLDLLKDKKVKALILDLRGNSGGSLSAAVKLSDLFLEKGKLIVSIKGRNIDQEFFAEKASEFKNIEMAVLINRGSASASEIVAAALQDHGRAIILGTRSYGKGVVESLFKLKLATALALTTATYYTPSRKSLQRNYVIPGDSLAFPYPSLEARGKEQTGGVIPDIPVPQNPDPEVVIKLFSAGVFFNFSRFLIDQKIQITKQFTCNDEILKTFFSFLRQTDDKLDFEEIRKHLDAVKREIERNVLSQKFSPQEGAKAYLKADPVVKKALEILHNTLVQRSGNGTSR
jgi:carboxyl-terminal processing protease